jgi:hypothetical protein
MKKAGAEQEKIIKGGQIKKITLKGVKISREGLKIFFLAGAGAGAPTSPLLPPLEKGCTLDL